MDWLEKYFHAMWYGGRKPPLLLRPLESVYRRVVEKKRRQFLSQPEAVYKPRAPVVIVGNITVGGTGKTPLTLHLIDAFTRRGLTVGVISRGYGGKAVAYPVLIDETSTADEVGDEPLMVFQRTGVPVVVDPDRVSAIKRLEAAAPVDVVISDDGLQHYALWRTYEIVVMDATRGVGNGRCLPSGPLREPLARLESVDAVVVNGGIEADLPASIQAQCQLRGSPLRLPTMYPMAIEADEVVPLTGVIGQKPCQQVVYGVAGIGNPGRFYSTLRNQGFQVKERPFSDHHRFQLSDFAGMKDNPVLMTEKDAVKVGPLGLSNGWYLKVSAQLPDDLIDDIIASIS